MRGTRSPGARFFSTFPTKQRRGRWRHFRCLTSFSAVLESPTGCPLPVLFKNILSRPLSDSTK
uniref:Uncharacterized protein n=1 Tax=Anolis carolinensis TaxID=28377 RepID=A0A803SN55_ANOCA